MLGCPNAEVRGLDIRPVLERLVRQFNGKPFYDDFYSDLQAVEMPDGTVITNDSGWSNLEVALPPHTKLDEARVAFEEKIDLLKDLVQDLKGAILGYGIQPLQAPDKKNWIRKRRHEVVCRNFGCDHDVNITVISASQVHVSVAREEVVLANNVFNWLTGVMVSLFANSPIWRGEIDPVRLAVRERMWWFTPDNRHGVFPGPCLDLEDLFNRILNMKHLVARNGRDYFLPRSTFKGFLKQNPDREFLSELPLLEGTLWFCSRPRSNYGTIEIRPACTQPREASMALPAFCLGIVENLQEAQKAIDDLGYPWNVCKELREIAMSEGLKGRIDDLDMAELSRIFLQIAERGLKARKLGEEKYLSPLWTRVETKTTLAEEVINIFKQGGLKSLVDTLSY